MPDLPDLPDLPDAPGDDDVAAVRAALRDALTTAMKQKDAKAMRVLRATLGAIDNAEAVPVAAPASPADVPSDAEGPIAGAAVGLGVAEAARRALTLDDVMRIIADEIDERRVAADEYEQAGRLQQAEKLRTEADVLRPFLVTT